VTSDTTAIAAISARARWRFVKYPAMIPAGAFMSRLLYVCHATAEWEATGTPLIASCYMAHALRAGHEVAVIVPGSRAVKIPGITSIVVPPALEEPWSIAAYAKAAEDVAGGDRIRRFDPDLVHVIDWLNLPSGVLKALGELRVPVVRHLWNCEDLCAFTEPICFMPDGRRCQVLTASQCGECVVRRLGQINMNFHGFIDRAIEQLVQLRAAQVQAIGTKLIAKWQTFHHHLDNLYSVVIFPCSSFRRYAEDLFPFGSVRRETIEHGVVERAITGLLPAKATPHFLFLGPFTDRKGWPIVEAAFSRLLSERPGSAMLRAYGASPQSKLSSVPGVSLLPPFAPSQLEAVLSWGSVGLVPSLFETFSRVCREFLAHGLAVVGSDAFGIPEAVIHGQNGLIIGHPSAEGLYQALIALLDEPGLHARLQAGARATRVRTQAEEFSELGALYQSLIAARPRRAFTA
jgi:glycosyltransferase involved in cell wall biosynthesis